MLFNSYVFIFLFLPISLIIFFQLGQRGLERAAIGWIVLCSVFFYAWWDFRYLLLIGLSILFNYRIGLRLIGLKGTPQARRVLVLAISANLLLLGYYKYAMFAVGTFNSILGTSFHVPTIILPLGISFFTFTQIAYLVDTYRNWAKEYRGLDYSLFVLFFPHLIAGPIIHHKDVIPQFGQKRIYKPDFENLSVGFSIFIIGLYKKAVLADSIAWYSSPVFALASSGGDLSFYKAWGGALAYTLQIYFDFSGYSDMAIGLARMFGILFPVNFNSPYKAANIADFWRRWHITLSTFLRDYLYIPLGGNRSGNKRRYFNVFVTMLLGGIWHGAGWTFVVWGALHGGYLAINHAWRDLRKSLNHDLTQTTFLGRLTSRILTFLAVMIAWVVFKADSMPTALRMFRGMLDFHSCLSGIAIDSVVLRQIAWTVGLLGVSWFLPNTQQLLARYNPAFGFKDGLRTLRPLLWRPNWQWAAFTSLLFVVAVLHLSKITEFLYFQF